MLTAALILLHYEAHPSQNPLFQWHVAIFDTFDTPKSVCYNLATSYSTDLYIYILNSFNWCVLFSNGYSICNGPDLALEVLQATIKETKHKAFFVQSYKVWQVNEKKVEMCFKGITDSEVCWELAAQRAHVVSELKQHIGFWEWWVGPFKYYNWKERFAPLTTSQQIIFT